MEIKDLKPRLYQESIFNTAAKSNTLVVLPTGLGKTVIAIMLAIHRLNQFPQSKVVFLAPTKPLCNQHIETFKKHLITNQNFEVLTGGISPEKRKELWETSQIVFATPQTIANDINKGKISLEKVSLLIVDEAHRAIGDYDYVFIAKNYMQIANNPRILALTASPGSEKEKIEQIRKNLFIESIEIRNEDSEDVIAYVQPKEIEKIEVEPLPQIKEISELIQKALQNRLNLLEAQGLIYNAKKIRKSDLIELQAKLTSQLKDNNYTIFSSISSVAACIKLSYALEILETQGINPFFEFIENLKEQAKKTRAAKSILKDINFLNAIKIAENLNSSHIEHPKMEVLKNLIVNNSNQKIIVFTQYRNTADAILQKLSNLKGIAPVKFIGQKSGLSQKKQIEIIKAFKEGEYNVLIATSIAEEGLHIENADIGIFFEPVPSALRSIQRKGRVGRTHIGKIYILVTKDTIDEKYYWVAYHKEKRMKKLINNIKNEIENSQKRIIGF